jgi:Fur family transcriptional regulator, zinc uptake regulator
MAAEFSRRTKRLLDQAGEVCQRRGAALTELRRDVLGLILDAASPSRAYDLLDRLRLTRRRAAPPTVYRTLDFLLDQGLIHRIERLSAFVGCIAGCTADPGEEAHTHSVQFLICCKCGKVIELRNRDVSAALAQAAQEIGFAIYGATVEAEGLCSTCQSPAVAV